MKADAQFIIRRLKDRSDPKNIAGMKRFAASGKNTLGVKIPVLRKIARDIKNQLTHKASRMTDNDLHQLAQELWKMEIHEARILASMIDNPKLVMKKQMDEWIKDFDSWDICDQVCMNLFDKTPFAFVKAIEWADSPHFAKASRGEYQRRAGFALMACLAWHDKKTADREFEKFFPAIKKASIDERNFVRKAVNWALRQIGKRNKNLNLLALKMAYDIEKIDSNSARWIAKDAIRELQTKFK